MKSIGPQSRLARLSIAALALSTLLSHPAAAHKRGGDQPTPYSTDVIFLEVLPAERGVALYERVIGLTPGARVAVGKAPRSVVVHDTQDRLARFRILVSMLDRGDASDHLYVRPVIHVAPSHLATLLLDVMNTQSKKGFILVPDDRSNKLVVRCRPDAYERLDKLIRRLDIPAKNPRKTGVVPATEGT